MSLECRLLHAGFAVEYNHLFIDKNNCSENLVQTSLTPLLIPPNEPFAVSRSRYPYVIFRANVLLVVLMYLSPAPRCSCSITRISRRCMRYERVCTWSLCFVDGDEVVEGAALFEQSNGRTRACMLICILAVPSAGPLAFLRATRHRAQNTHVSCCWSIRLPAISIFPHVRALSAHFYLICACVLSSILCLCGMLDTGIEGFQTAIEVPSAVRRCSGRC